MDPKHPGLGTIEKALRDREAKTGKRSPMLDAVEVPEGFVYLFGMFWEIKRGAAEGMNGSKITWHDLADYQALTGIALDAFEVEAIMAMDSAVTNAAREEA